MVATEASSIPNYAHIIGIERDQLVKEFGWKKDSDNNIRVHIEEACGFELLDESINEVIDVALLWWRNKDGDLVDKLMDIITSLNEDGVIWIMTPKTGRSGYVMPVEIAAAAPTAGLMQTSSFKLGNWMASRLVQSKSKTPGKKA